MKLHESGPTTGPDQTDGLSSEELEAEMALDLPEREALSVAFPLGIAASPVEASKGAKALADAVGEEIA